eukprot:CAMPEP_0171089932 /NCGR_PEP_ID=MMETSP0766_2-20121228/27714_1 /TAXON_ID=439317 /ORGANISM="Gambierdiscus australes, Strain CAWD 149" /LENGTH=51 /DNA_ID=CAMNT_0011547857 /DNA_START=9 /DNA_END=161 /DNA_ORIENTATION=+
MIAHAHSQPLHCAAPLTGGTARCCGPAGCRGGKNRARDAPSNPQASTRGSN